MKFFSADWHWDHKNILKYDNLPYSSVDEMNKAIIDGVNEKVAVADEFYFLGDISIHNKIPRIRELLDQIKCKNITWLLGNHDSPKYRDAFPHIKFYDYLELKSDNRFFVLCHYQFESWKHSNHGSIHLYGHTHSNPSNETKKRMNVGFGCHLKVLNIYEIIDLMKDKDNKNHHANV